MAKRKKPTKARLSETPDVRGVLGSDLSRREFLAGLATATGALALGGCGNTSVSGENPESAPLPDPESSGIQHVVVLMMENRSFDHFLGWVPGADGVQTGLEFADKEGRMHPTFPLAPNFQNCQFADPDHSYTGGREQLNGGANDGWLLSGTDDLFPIGYYKQDDHLFYGGAVPAWTTFDRYFCSILSSTYPNRFYMHAAQTDRLSNSLSVSSIATIWDRVAAKGLSGTYYYSDLPVTALWGQRLLPISKRLDQFFADAAAGTLSNVTFIDPSFIDEGAGTSNDDHPLADIRNGQVLVSRVYDALTSSPNWPDTVFVVNYDEWGGFYDHVVPPQGPQTALDRQIGNDGRLGFRVPCLLASPLARRGFVAKNQYDHTSVLSMIEWRWGLEPLTVVDASTENMAHALDFQSKKNLDVPRFSVPSGPYGQACFGDVTEFRPDLAGLRALAIANGFPI